MTNLKLLATSPTADMARDAVRQFFYMPADFDPLVPTEDEKVFQVRNSTKLLPRYRVKLKGKRWRFEAETPDPVWGTS